MLRSLGFFVLIVLSGCSADLFHDTSWDTVCGLDAQSPGCPGAQDAEAEGSGQDAGTGDRAPQ